MDKKALYDLLLFFLGSSSFTVIVILYLFKNPDKFEHWARLFYQLLNFISSKIPTIRNKIDKSLVAYSIQDTVNHIAYQLDKEAPGIFPHAMKVEWVDIQNPESFLSKGKAIVRLKHYSNQDKNKVDSTLFFIKKAFMPRAKNYIDKTFREVCEYKIASRIFSHKNADGAFDYFIENILNPVLENDPNIKKDLQTVENIDSAGYFTRVLLNEIRITSQKLLGTMPTDTVKSELREFASFLENIVNKGRDERVPLDFRGVKIKATVILIAKAITINHYGIDPYVNRVKWAVKEGFETIYLAGWGERFVQDILEIKSIVEERFVTTIRRYEYPIHVTSKAILLTCAPKASFLARQKELQDEVTDCFMKLIPEIERNEITISSISRIKGVGFKVAVRSEADKHSNPKDSCFGANGEILKRIKKRFPDEFISIINWTDDYQKLISESLRPLTPKYIDQIIIDEENLIADVKLTRKESVAKAIGKNGNNVKIASELTGFIINIDLAESFKDDQSPEEELRTILNKIIPEINNGEIDIVNIARIKDVGSKVIVRWATKNVSNYSKAWVACIGKDKSNIQKIREYFPNEWIGFHEFSEDCEDQISFCLYPVRNDQIESIEIDDSSELAVVTVQKQSQINISDENLTLCEMVTGYQIEIL